MMARCSELICREGMSPAIDCQPQSRLKMVGNTARFSVTAIGAAPLTCQWRKNGVNLADGAQPSGATISGATTDDLTLANVQMSDAGSYTVVVTNSYGSVTSSVAALTVQLPTPTVLTPDGSGSFISNGFGFNLSGMAGQTVVIEASTEPDLLDATPDQFTANGLFLLQRLRFDQLRPAFLTGRG